MSGLIALLIKTLKHLQLYLILINCINLSQKAAFGKSLLVFLVKCISDNVFVVLAGLLADTTAAHQHLHPLHLRPAGRSAVLLATAASRCV